MREEYFGVPVWLAEFLVRVDGMFDGVTEIRDARDIVQELLKAWAAGTERKLLAAWQVN